jgi:hypothetical protein
MAIMLVQVFWIRSKVRRAIRARALAAAAAA